MNRSSILALTMALTSVLAVPMATLATDPPPSPYLWSLDAPFTRNREVAIAFVQPSGHAIDSWLLSNSVDGGGQLASPTAVSSTSQWSLPDSDGAHTVYGQLHYVDFGWSAVISLGFQLTRGTGSSLYVDFDSVSAGQDGRAISRTPTATFTAHKTPVDDSPLTGFEVTDGTWMIGFYNSAGTFAAGTTYAIGPNVGASIWHAPLYPGCTVTGGSFTVNEVRLFEGRDLDKADIDFRLLCGSNVMAGSVRYGSSRNVIALDQDVELLQLGAVNVGENSTKAVTLTNIGDAAVAVGTAAISDGAQSSHPEDYSIMSDTCSNTSLAVNGSCQIQVTLTPSGTTNRNALLTIGDNTPRGSRQWRLLGSGVQPTTLKLEKSGSTDAPGPITFKMTITPPTGDYGPSFALENGPPLHTLQWTVQELSDPARREYSTTVELAPGTYTASATFQATNGYLGSTATPVQVVMTGDTTPPTGQVIITATGGTPYTNDPNLRVQFPATDAESAVTELSITTSNWGFSSWITYPYNDESADQDWYLPADDPNYFPVSEGLYTFRAKWKNAAGVWSDPVDASIALDTIVPKVDPPTQLLVENSRVSGGKVVVEVPLSGDGGISGISDFDLAQKTDSGSWKSVEVPGVTAGVNANSTVDRLLAPQHKYAFRGRATDGATNISSWVKGPTVNLKSLQQSASRIHYGGTWKTLSRSSYWGGSARKSTTNGATASLTLTGRAVAWVATTGADRGKARVYIDGQLVDTVNLYSAATVNQVVVWAHNWATATTHTVKIEVFGSGKPVELDAFVTAE